MIAVCSPRVSRWRSTQLKEAFRRPPEYQEKSTSS
jgi:hypothetical protein